jgi:uncharacterized repeat protein (TIGR03847 family)
MFVFDPPDRFVAGTIGVPGNRTFFLQARRSGQVVSVVLEKVQVAVLAERLGVLLDELEERGISTAAAAVDDQPLDEPINEAFRATTLTLGWDGDADRILVEARAEAGGDEDDDEEADDDDDDEPDEDETVIDLSTVEGLAGTPAGELLAAFEAADNDDEGPDTLRVRLTADAARGFVNRAIEVVGAGRLPCPLCGQPLDPQGHICPRRNGHYVN